MTVKNPDLRLFNGRYLAFSGEFLGNSNLFLSEEQKQASQIMRDTFTENWKPGKDAVSFMHQIERRALEAIKRDGIEAFIESHSRREVG